jgi:hypothetical protein
MDWSAVKEHPYFDMLAVDLTIKELTTQNEIKYKEGKSESRLHQHFALETHSTENVTFGNSIVKSIDYPFTFDNPQHEYAPATIKCSAQRPHLQTGQQSHPCKGLIGRLDASVFHMDFASLGWTHKLWVLKHGFLARHALWITIQPQ